MRYAPNIIKNTYKTTFFVIVGPHTLNIAFYFMGTFISRFALIYHFGHVVYLLQMTLFKWLVSLTIT